VDEFILEGTPEQLQQQIPLLYAQWLMQQQDANIGCRFSPRELPDSVQTKLRIYLQFREVEAQARSKRLENPKYKAVESLISVRDRRINPETVSDPSFVEPLAKLIIQKFATFIWKRGRIMCTYCDKKNAIDNMKILAVSAAEGRKVAEQILDIVGLSFDGSCFNSNTNAEPEERYSTVGRTKTFLGKTYKADIQRPVVDLAWYAGFVFVPPANQVIKICDNKGWSAKQVYFEGS
jgi:N-acyl-D-aspartate/D-glutamate deacylase